MNKYIYSFLFIMTMVFFACTEKQPNSIPQQDSMDTDTIMVGNDTQETDKISADTLEYCIKDTLQTGEKFYIKSKIISTKEDPYNDTTTLYLYHYDNGEDKLIDTAIIEGFYSSSLSDYPECYWLDTCFILNDTTKAYGHTVYGSNSSYVDHLISKNVYFIAVTPHSINYIFYDFLSHTSCRDYDSGHDDCEGIENSFKTADTKTNGYYDIVVTQKNWQEVLKDGEKYSASDTVLTYTLVYKNGKYVKKEGQKD